MTEVIALVAWPLAAALMTGIAAGLAFKGFEMYMEHREKAFVHAPLAEMQRKLDELEARILNGAMSGRR